MTATTSTPTHGAKTGNGNAMTDTADPAFWDRIAEKYSKSPIKDMPAYEQTMERVRAHLKPTDHVLEVGCGTASTALLLSPEVAHVTASDLSSKMIDIGREKARKSKTENIDFVVGTPFCDALTPGSYDAVMAFSFLHLVEDLPATLARIHELLKPGGLLISKTVCLAEQTRLWGIPIAVMRFFGYAPYVNLLKTADLEREIAGAGFRIIETGNYPAGPRSRFIVAKKT
ncbi:MAG: class I SAM-dependent methyltransferase [Hyphomicrobiaceae bacterium]|nr:class I SAM-dependent methyltransferase [Hyphomicrobiaceae bacterium]